MLETNRKHCQYRQLLSSPAWSQLSARLSKQTEIPRWVTDQKSTVRVWFVFIFALGRFQYSVRLEKDFWEKGIDGVKKRRKTFGIKNARSPETRSENETRGRSAQMHGVCFTFLNPRVKHRALLMFPERKVVFKASSLVLPAKCASSLWTATISGETKQTEAWGNEFEFFLWQNFLSVRNLVSRLVPHRHLKLNKILFFWPEFSPQKTQCPPFQKPLKATFAHFYASSHSVNDSWCSTKSWLHLLLVKIFIWGETIKRHSSSLL